PHIKFEQAKKLAQALPGDPHTGRIIKESIKGKARASSALTGHERIGPRPVATGHARTAWREPRFAS
ncbi:MAG: hypothetical protein WBP81_32025, partial [Solirubrobacteraceae bacterium]